MQIGCCENCRYVDMIENMGGECPRCGARLIPVGIESLAWNRMSQKDKNTVLSQLFRETEEEPEESTEEAVSEEGVDAVMEPVPIPDEALADESMFTPGAATVFVSPTGKHDAGEDTQDSDTLTAPEDDSVEAVADFVEKLFAEANGVLPENTEENETDAAGGDGDPQQTDEQDQVEQDPTKQEEKEYVYVCYKCNNIAGHDGSRNRYFCMDCGSDMIPVGCSASEWMDLSKEEKRNAAEDAKIRHMVQQIKNASFDDNEDEGTQNIINVV